MQAIEAYKARLNVLQIKGSFTGVVRSVVVLFLKGLSLGVMLFFALSTVSLLNQGKVYFETSLKSQAKNPGKSRNLVIPRNVYSRPHVLVPRSVLVARDARNRDRTLRESSHLLRAIEPLVRKLGSFAR